MPEAHLLDTGSASAAAPHAMLAFDQSGEEDSSAWLSIKHMVQSLGVSRDAGCMQYALIEAIFSHSAAAPSFKAQLFPMFMDEVCFKRAVEHRSSIPDPGQARLAVRLSAAFEADPLVDGLDHPAEELIGEALRSVRRELIQAWFQELALDQVRPSFAASILRCLGRQASPGTASWREKLIRDALALDDVELRDAAVQAAELWGGSDVVDVLKSHYESEPWLRAYIQDVIDDLCE